MTKSSDEKTGEQSLTRHERIRPTPEAPAARLRKTRGLPATLGGAALGFLAFGLFWIQMALRYDAVDVMFQFVGLMILVAAALVVVMKIVLPRAKRRIRALDTRAWNALADTHGLRRKRGRRPRLKGTIDGIPLGIAYQQVGGARTEGRAKARRAYPARLQVNPRGAEYSRRKLVATGDAVFDRSFRVESADPTLVARTLTPELRRRIRALESVEIDVEGTTVRVRSRRYLEYRAELDEFLAILVTLANGG